MRHRILFAGAAAAGAGALWFQPDVPDNLGFAYMSGSAAARFVIPEVHSESAPLTRVDYLDKVPSRAEQLHKLADGSERNPFDVLIIGGGATGTGCALDAVTR